MLGGVAVKSQKHRYRGVALAEKGKKKDPIRLREAECSLSTERPGAACEHLVRLSCRPYVEVLTCGEPGSDIHIAVTQDVCQMRDALRLVLCCLGSFFLTSSTHRT